jgi:hypothetical protein
MSNSPLSVRAKFEGISAYGKSDVDDGLTSFMDVRFWLEREGKILAVADVTIYFKSGEVFGENTKASALAYAQRIFSQIAENHASTSADPTFHEVERVAYSLRRWDGGRLNNEASMRKTPFWRRWFHGE